MKKITQFHTTVKKTKEFIYRGRRSIGKIRLSKFDSTDGPLISLRS